MWSPYGYAWRYIVDDQTYIRNGEMEIDINTQEGGLSAITAKGHSKQNHDIAFGMHIVFSNDSLFIDIPSRVFTGYLYQSNQWYYLKCKFDCDEGAKGKYEMWIKPKFSNEELKYLGKFDFRDDIIGINHFGLTVGDLNYTIAKNAKFDNIKFINYNP